MESQVIHDLQIEERESEKLFLYYGYVSTPWNEWFFHPELGLDSNSPHLWNGVIVDMLLMVKTSCRYTTKEITNDSDRFPEIGDIVWSTSDEKLEIVELEWV